MNNSIDTFIITGFKGTLMTAEYPLRDFKLLEFYEKIKKENDIVAVYFDTENHIISFVCNTEVKKND